MGPLLDGKVALITGASRGLGQAIAGVFAGEGARVAFTYVRDEQGSRRTLENCQSARATVRLKADTTYEQRADTTCARAFQVSVLDAQATTSMVVDIEREWGAVDILVNNAGVSQNMPLALMEEEDWDRVMDINVKGTFLTSKAVLRGMIRRKRGVVLNIGSLVGVRMLEAPIHYCASKAAIKGLTEALAKEVARYGIRVNCLAPGLLEDGVGRNLPDHRLGDYLKHCALGRVGTLDEVARLAAFLVSDANGYMSGETVVIDGGV
jgi:NAD(P)-dependent dehydrogenase (short-subunit alcohol dehydrogenase family)